MAETREMAHRPDMQPRRMEEEFRVPAVDIFESDENLILLADMPGVADQNVEVSVEENSLFITGRVERKAEAGNLLYAEFEPMSFRRVFTLSDDIRADGIEGKMQNGVLRLTLPKAEQAKVKKIPIKAD